MTRRSASFPRAMIYFVRILVCSTLIVAGERIDEGNNFNEYVAVDRIIKPECGVDCFPDLRGINVETTIKNHDGDTVFTFNRFPTIETIFRYMSYLASKYEDRIQIFDIGITEERLPIRLMRITSHDFNSTVWVDGGIHAREWISITSVIFIMYMIAEHWRKLGPAVQNTEFFLLPLMNPDGYRYSYTKERLWRKNRRFTNECYGIDLNRNFPYKWGTVHYLIKDGMWQQKKPCNEIYEGDTPLSEQESRAVVRFFENTDSNFKAFLTFHSYGRRINYPYGYEPRVPKDVSLINYVAMKAKYKIANATNVQYDVSPLSMTDYVSPGNSIDWAYQMNISFSYLIELSQNDFIVPTEEIIPTGKEAFIITKTVVDNLYMSEKEKSETPDVEIFDEVIRD